MFYGDAEWIIPNQYAPSLMKLRQVLGRLPGAWGDFTSWAGGGQGLNKKEGDGRLRDVISSHIIFDIVEILGIWAQGALRHLDLPVVLSQRIPDLSIVTESHLFTDELLLKSLSKYQATKAPECLPLTDFQSQSELTVLQEYCAFNRLAGIFLWKPSRYGNLTAALKLAA